MLSPMAGRARAAEGLIRAGRRPTPPSSPWRSTPTWPGRPPLLIGVSLADAVGDRRAQNIPGTSDEYPNWRIPLCDGGGTAVLLEDLPGAAAGPGRRTCRQPMSAVQPAAGTASRAGEPCPREMIRGGATAHTAAGCAEFTPRRYTRSGQSYGGVSTYSSQGGL